MNHGYFKRSFLYIILLWVIFLSGCQDTGKKEIVIISTNDVHAQIDQLPKLATFVERIRAKYPNVILVDAGDRFTGNPHVDYAEQRGKPIITLMNKLGYAVGTLGNHEFDFGQKILHQRIKEAKFPIVCANINSSHTELDSISPYHILEIDGIKLAFLGLLQTSSEGIPSANPDNLKGLTFDDFKIKAIQYKDLKEKCDVFIGLTHLGDAADSVLALSMPVLDLIIGGHTHTLLEKPKIINNVMIGQAGSNLTHAGLTILRFNSKQLAERTYQSINIDTITPQAPEITEMVQYFNEHPDFNEVVGHASHPLSIEELANLVTASIREASQSDFAFYNRGGIRVKELPQGDITLESLYKVEPFGNHIFTLEMTVEDIKLLLLNRYNEQEEQIHPDLFMSGGTYTILTDHSGKGIDVTLKDKSGKIVPTNKRYKVALNDYINARYHFPGRGQGLQSEITVIKAITNYLKKHPTL